MPASLPSKKISVVDVPEVTGLRAEFNYNFFVPDERVNELGSVPAKFLERPSEKFDAEFVETIEFNRSVPRYIEFFWRPVLVGTQATGNGLRFVRTDTDLAVSVRTNLDKIYYEDDFAFQDFTAIHLQDADGDTTMRFLVEKAFDNIVGDTAPQSLQDRARRLNAVTSPQVSSKTIAGAMNSLKALNVRFFDRSTGNPAEIVDRQTQELKTVRSSIQINNKVIYDVLSTAATDDTVTPLTNELRSETKRALGLQESAIKNRDSNILSADEFDSEITKPVTIYNVDTDGYESTLQAIGYVIEKYEILEDGSVRSHAPLVVENPAAATTVDVQLKYGARYYYQVRTIAYVEIQTHDLQSNSVMAVGFLVASKPTRTENIVCEEYAPPPPPSDFQVAWDYTRGVPRLTWSFPPNSQRDVKYFQVFRRPALNQPFQLVKMFDFDDSVVRTELNESFIDPVLVEKLTSPSNHFLDREFHKDMSQVYCVCAVDAHGMSSNYSTQFHVAFDRQSNKLIKRIVSVAGAPKAYPNLYLNIDTFVDTIKDEGHSQVRVVFNPEYLRVMDSHDNDLGLLKTNELDCYKLNLINIDLQTQQTLTINLVDRTKKRLLTRSTKRTSDDSLTDTKTANARTTAGQKTGSGTVNSVAERTTFTRR